METNNIIAIGAILLGAVLCTSGYKVQKFLITIAWFAIGFTLANVVCSYFELSKEIILIIEIIAGLILGCLGFKLEKLAILIAVAYLVYSTVGTYLTDLDPNIALIAKVVISLIVGGLAVLFIRPILIIASSLYGANLIKLYLPAIISIPTNILTIIIFIFFVGGIIIQFKFN